MNIVYDKYFSKFLDSDQFKDLIKSIDDVFFYDAIINVKKFDNFKLFEEKLGKKVPEWVIATNHEHEIWVLDPSRWPQKDISTPEQIIAHEIVHIIVNHSFETIPPLWIGEGMAIVFAKQTEAIETFDDVKNPYDETYNDNLYRDSAKVIQAIFDQYGTENAINYMRSLKDFEHDKVYGYTAINDFCKILNQRS